MSVNLDLNISVKLGGAGNTGADLESMNNEQRGTDGVFEIQNRFYLICITINVVRFFGIYYKLIKTNNVCYCRQRSFYLQCFLGGYDIPGTPHNN